MSQRGVDMLKDFSERHETDIEPFEEWRERWLNDTSWDPGLENHKEIIEHGRE